MLLYIIGKNMILLPLMFLLYFEQFKIWEKIYLSIYRKFAFCRLNIYTLSKRLFTRNESHYIYLLNLRYCAMIFLHIIHLYSPFSSSIRPSVISSFGFSYIIKGEPGYSFPHFLQ